MRHERREATTTLSSKVIEYLREKGHTQAEMAKMLRVTEGFVSLVKSRERSLTLDHLELLAGELGVPIGAMLIAVAKPKKELDERQKKLYEAADEIILQADRAIEAIMKAPAKKGKAAGESKGDTKAA